MPTARHTALLLRACCLTLLLLAGWAEKVRLTPAHAAEQTTVAAKAVDAGRPALRCPEWLTQEALAAAPDVGCGGAPGLLALLAWPSTYTPYGPHCAFGPELLRLARPATSRLCRQLLRTAISPNAP